ncbi:hypothetical protein K2X40_00120 [Candidatus Babeliales bacterium]|nr:hypothetical protein [Candidatus Babeliales bacterium]
MKRIIFALMCVLVVCVGSTFPAAGSCKIRQLKKSCAIRPGATQLDISFAWALNYFATKRYDSLESILWQFPNILNMKSFDGKTLQQLAQGVNDQEALSIIASVQAEAEKGVFAECGRRGSF